MYATITIHRGNGDVLHTVSVPVNQATELLFRRPVTADGLNLWSVFFKPGTTLVSDDPADEPAVVTVP